MKEKIKCFFEKKENIFLALALSLGLLMAVFNPPFAGVPDEHAHYWKAWSIADGYWKCTGEDKIPQTAVALPDQIKPVKYEGIKENKIVVAKLKEKLFEKDNKEKAVIGGANCPATPFGYVSQATGLRIGQALGISALASFYLARILTLFLSVLLFYWAIRIVPFGKIIFLVVGLLPMTIRQFASLSYDGIAIAFAALFVALILKLAMEKEKYFTKKNLFFLLTMALFGLNVKLGYFAMSLLIFLLPESKFKSKRDYWLTMMGFVALNLLAVFAIRATFVDIAKPDWTDPQKQMSFVLHAPLHFLNVVFDSYYGADGFVPHIEGIVFKTAGVSVNGIFYVFVFLGILLFLRNQEEEVALSRKQRFIMLGVFLANFFIIYLALYLGWSKPGAKSVSGVQGRYFLAIIPLLIFSFYKSGFSLKSVFVKKNQTWLFPVLVLFAFWFVFAVIYEAHYLKEKQPKNPVYEEFLKNEK